jgi:predicted nucleic acid-binding protein
VDVEEVVITAFTELELLQGCRDEQAWELLASYLRTQDLVDPSRHTWSAAARTYFDLRRRGRTVRSPIDCCIAQLAIDHRALLVHNDCDFEIVAEIRPLQQLRLS